MLLRAPLTLKVLSLAGVGCGDAGVSALASALGSTSAVLVISLDQDEALDRFIGRGSVHYVSRRPSPPQRSRGGSDRTPSSGSG